MPLPTEALTNKLLYTKNATHPISITPSGCNLLFRFHCKYAVNTPITSSLYQLWGSTYLGTFHCKYALKMLLTPSWQHLRGAVFLYLFVQIFLQICNGDVHYLILIPALWLNLFGTFHCKYALKTLPLLTPFVTPWGRNGAQFFCIFLCRFYCKYAMGTSITSSLYHLWGSAFFGASPQFYFSFWRPTLISCEWVVADACISRRHRPRLKREEKLAKKRKGERKKRQKRETVCRCKMSRRKMCRCKTSRRKMWRCKMSRRKMCRCKMNTRKMCRCKMSRRKMCRCKMSWRKMCRCKMSRPKMFRCKMSWRKMWRCKMCVDIVYQFFLFNLTLRRSREKL